jgi:hypothetical protein
LAAAPAVLRVMKRRKALHETCDERASQRLLEGEGEVAAALRIYTQSVVEDINHSNSCESDVHDDCDDRDGD